MVIVSPGLIKTHLIQDSNVEKVYNFLETDNEVQTLLKMSNIMAVERYLYNDHGVLHSQMVSGSALEILNLVSKHIKPSSIKSWNADSYETKIIVLCGAYLHDVGNSVHRLDHSIHSCYLANNILDRLLQKSFPDEEIKKTRMKSEILHAIYSHDYEIQCLSLEAGVCKVADGTDMSQGRARIPFQKGKSDIHAHSAMSIEKVEIEEGQKRPIRINIHMNSFAGLFQVEQVLMEKVETSGIEHLLEIASIKDEKIINVKSVDFLEFDDYKIQ